MTSAAAIENSVDWEAHTSNLVELMTPHYFDLLEIAYGDAQDELPGLLQGTWDIHNPEVAKTVKDLAQRVVGISDTTREDLRGVLDRVFAAEKTPGIPEIARMIRESGAVSSMSRARKIARTETGTAYNVGAVSAYRQAGVERVEVLDGDCSICQPYNGQIWTLAEAQANPLQHPNCVRAFAPVVGDVRPVEAPPPPAAEPQPTDPYVQRFSGDTFRDFTNTGQMELFGKRYYSDWAESLSREEIDGLRGYQERAYGPINDILRGIRLSDFDPEKRAFYQAYIDGIDSAIGRTSIPYNVNTYRGFNAGMDLAPGSVFTDNGFVSTSLNPTTAAKFAIDNNGVVARISVPRGTKGAYLDALNSKEEYEVLMSRGTTFEVVSVGEEEMLGRTVKVVELKPVGAGKSDSMTLEEKADNAEASGRAARFMWGADDIVILKKGQE